MLVLSRKMNERVRIRRRGTEECVWVTIVEIDRGKIRLGFEDHKEFEFLRAELVEKIDTDRKEQEESSKS